MYDIDILENLRELKDESRALLDALERLNSSFDNCVDLVVGMHSMSSRIKRAAQLYSEILSSNIGL